MHVQFLDEQAKVMRPYSNTACKCGCSSCQNLLLSMAFAVTESMRPAGSASQLSSTHITCHPMPFQHKCTLLIHVQMACSDRTQKDGQKTEPASAAQASVHLSSAIPAKRLDDQDCLFLGGVQLHLCCCNPEEQLQLVRIAREGCALRHADLSSGLTHIVVRSPLVFDLGMSC